MSEGEAAGGTPFKRRPSSGSDSSGQTLPSQPGVETPIAASGVPSRPVEELATELLRLRDLKRQHDTVRDGLVAAEQRLQQVPPYALLRLHCYLEQQLGDPKAAGHLQTPFVQLIKAMCLACRLQFRSTRPEALLASARELLCESHGLAGRLRRLPPLTPDESKALAPCLVHLQGFRPLRDEEVNACFAALAAWASAFYAYSRVAGQMGPVEDDIREHEALLGCGAAGPRAPRGARRVASPPCVPMGSPSRGQGGHPSMVRGLQRLACDGAAATRGHGMQRMACDGAAATRRSIDRRPQRDAAAPAAAPGVQRMHSDRLLSTLLRCREVRSPSPETPEQRRRSPAAAQLTQAARPVAGLPTVPERCASLPPALFEEPAPRRR